MTKNLIGLILLLTASTAASFRFSYGRAIARFNQDPSSCSTIRVTQSRTKLSAEVKETVEDENLNEQFKEWEAEEEEIQRRELEDTVRQARADGTEDELPDYMMR